MKDDPFYLSPSSRVLEIALVLYCPISFLIDVLHFRRSEIDSYAFILHDQDSTVLKDESGNDLLDEHGSPLTELKQPHVHLLLKFHRRITASVVRRWFFRIDENGLKETVLIKRVLDRVSAYEYLIHKYDPDKFQYDPKKRKCNNPSAWLDEFEAPDLLTGALFDLLDGKSHKYLCSKYGSQFIIHQERVYQSRDRILAEEARGLDRRYDDPLDELVLESFR